MVDGLAAGSARGTAGGAGDEPGENRTGDAAARHADRTAYQAGYRASLGAGQDDRHPTSYTCRCADGAANPPCNMARFRPQGLALWTRGEGPRGAGVWAKELVCVRSVRMRLPRLVFIE
ncbi:hypothetical protein MAFF211479_05930 [Ralstonia solanacearum]|nr:hypothetical protein MAFF211479_05930 [Ralstonia solanacearum]BCN03456.1 hypothetical protein RPSB_05930 [Ralstonia solanacearum]